jgi:hypothetical protein
MAHTTIEWAFRRHSSLSYVCDLISPWWSWLMGVSDDLTATALDAIRTFSGSLTPSYADVSFYAAALAQTGRLHRPFDELTLIVLAAQANVPISTAAARAGFLRGLFEADGIGLLIPADLGALSDVIPDSRMVIAADEQALTGNHLIATQALLGVDQPIFQMVRRFLGYSAMDSRSLT